MLTQIYHYLFSINLQGINYDKKENYKFLNNNEDGITRVSVLFANEDIWFNRLQIAEIYVYLM